MYDNVFTFQFHKGTIKTEIDNLSENDRRYFNSIKVRLKLPSSSAANLVTLFQFHKGTIKTLLIIS